MDLHLYREHLRELVDERTQELIELNAELHWEIVERKHVETALLESEEKFWLLFENASEDIIYHVNTLHRDKPVIQCLYVDALESQHPARQE